tara:strand:+ start:568 stop:711 length:144 start_codon:yes stop_codon:yes gene_type:complete
MKNCPECGFVLDQDEQDHDILVCHKCGLGWDNEDDKKEEKELNNDTV